MTGWRLTAALLLGAVIGTPVFLPFIELVRSRDAWHAWDEAGRIATLAGNTFALVGGSLAICLPAGIIGAVFLDRTDLPLRSFLRFITFLSLFVPLPLSASAWQAALGSDGWLPIAVWSTPAPGDPDITPSGIAWKPWAEGLPAAIWVQAVAALPWVIILVGQGLRWVERELEEDALTRAGPWTVLCKVTLPRARGSVLAAGLWVALSAATEITISDMMRVRTFAEEIYTQFVAGDRGVPLDRAVAVSLPIVALTWILVLRTSVRWERNLPPLETYSEGSFPLRLRWARWPSLVASLVVAGVLVGVPVASLIWKAGLGGNPQCWSGPVVVSHLATAFRVRGGLVLKSLLLAGFTGCVTAGLALVLCWLALGSRWMRNVTLSLMALVWALSGPIIGIGLKETINGILDLTQSYPLAVALYYGPSPLPAVWAQVIRFFPCAVAILWPVVRLLPQELRDAAQIDGFSPGQELRRVVFPLAGRSCRWAGVAVGVLSLGELSAGKLVETPGSQTFAHEVFTQMHYGVTNDLAALCLILLGTVIAGASLLALLRQRVANERLRGRP